MRADIAEAKRKLALPALMHRLGLGEHAKKSSKCPFHDDQHSSFSVWRNGDGAWFFKCHAGCGQGDEITFLELYKSVSNRDAIKIFLGLAGNDETTRTPSKPTSTMSLEWSASKRYPPSNEGSVRSVVALFAVWWKAPRGKRGMKRKRKADSRVTGAANKVLEALARPKAATHDKTHTKEEETQR
jgi:hypothetical protein